MCDLPNNLSSDLDTVNTNNQLSICFTFYYAFIVYNII